MIRSLRFISATAMLLVSALLFTSCEGAFDDIFGEWSRPVPGSSTGGAGTVTSISIDPTLALKVGETGQLTATVDPAGTAVTWSSDQEAVATVDANGLVTAKADGTATITATAGDKTATCEVTVTPGLATPLTVEAKTQGTIKVTNPQSGMKYSLNGGAKQAVTTDAITVAVGDKVQFYGKGTDITAYYSADSNSANDTNISGGTAQVKVYGNIMSLVDETGFATNTELTEAYTFKDLFYGNAQLTDASGLLLPAMTLKANCYQGMFCLCTSLTTAPKLPAETLATSCYGAMFDGCSSLTTAYVKAAYTTDGSFTNMFKGCTAAGTKTLHTTTASKTSWDGVMPSTWAGWTAVDDWND